MKKSGMEKNDEAHWSALMAQAQQGNEQAYRQLLSELAEAIAAYLRSRFGDVEVLEDCVQESLIAVHQARDSYEPDRLFRPWLFAIVRYKSIDVLRKKNNFYKVLKSQQLSGDELVHDFDKRCDEAVNCGQILSALSDKHRQAIVLTKLEGLTMREAAKCLQISEGAMKVRVHRALDASRQLLEAEFQ